MEEILIEFYNEFSGRTYEVHIENEEASVWTRDTKLVENRTIVIDKQYNVINMGNTYILKAQTDKQSGVHDTRWIEGSADELRFKYNNLEITIESKYIIRELETDNVAEAVDTMELPPDEFVITATNEGYVIRTLDDKTRAKLKLLGRWK